MEEKNPSSIPEKQQPSTDTPSITSHPEIDLPKQSNATNSFPLECPGIIHVDLK